MKLLKSGYFAGAVILEDEHVQFLLIARIIFKDYIIFSSLGNRFNLLSTKIFEYMNFFYLPFNIELIVKQ